MKRKIEINAPVGRLTKGSITRLLRGRACGFIRTREGEEVFFHARDLEGTKYSDVDVSRTVVFELIDDPVSGPRATRVRYGGVLRRRPLK